MNLNYEARIIDTTAHQYANDESNEKFAQEMLKNPYT